MTNKKTAECPVKKIIMASAQDAAKIFRDIIRNRQQIDHLTLEDLALEALLHVKSKTDIEGPMIEEDVIQTIRETLASIAHIHGVEIIHLSMNESSRFGGPISDSSCLLRRIADPV